MHKIGIGITTHNRPETFIKTMEELYFRSGLWGQNEGEIIWAIVDDASSNKYAEVFRNNSEWPKGTDRYYRFEENAGIARAKNKCLEMLEDCEHIFLFDDDIYPIVDNWYEPYIESGENHLMYIFKDFATPSKLNDTIELWRNDKIVSYSHARGPMLYLRNEVLKKVGGMDPIFGRWGYEHPDYSNRIFNAGLSSYRYADVVDSHKLFYCHDEHQTVETNVKGPERLAAIARNKEIYNKRVHSARHVPYKDKQNVIITTYFTGVLDPQKGKYWNFDADAIRLLMDSRNGTPIIFISDGDFFYSHGANFTNYKVKATHNPYFQRWISIREYLIANRDSIGRVFCTDATDVIMLRDPFPHMEHGKLYTGDENEKVCCPWIMNHHPHNVLKAFYKQYAHSTLLNAGLLGGDVDIIIEFLTKVVDFYFNALTDMHYHQHNKQAYDPGMTDMAIFNYIAYTHFASYISHGRHVNTVFKANETNGISWFKHK